MSKKIKYQQIYRLISLFIYIKFIQDLSLVITSNIQLNRPSIITWVNQQSQNHTLLVFDISTTKKIIAQEKLSLPSSFEIEYQNGLYLPSSSMSHIYEFREIKNEVSVKYIHIKDDQLVSEGHLKSQGQKISKIFDISPYQVPNSTIHSSCTYIKMDNISQNPNIFEFESFMVSDNPTCFVISPMMQHLWDQYHCETLSPHYAIQQKLYIQQFPNYQINNKILQIGMGHFQSAFHLTMKNDGQFEYLIEPLEIDQETEIEFNGIWQRQNQMLLVTLSNLKSRYEYIQLSCSTNNIEYCNHSIIMSPHQNKTLYVHIPNPQSSITIELIGIQAKNSFSVQIEDVLDGIETIDEQDHFYEEEQFRKSFTFQIIIGVISGVILVIVCPVFFGCMYRRRKKRREEHCSKQQITPNTKQTDGNDETEKKEHIIENLDNIQIMPPLTCCECLKQSTDLTKYRSNQ